MKRRTLLKGILLSPFAYFLVPSEARPSATPAEPKEPETPPRPPTGETYLPMGYRPVPGGRLDREVSYSGGYCRMGDTPGGKGWHRCWCAISPHVDWFTCDYDNIWRAKAAKSG